MMLEGVDISEHQDRFPNGPMAFVIIRTVNENGREDRRWRAHKAEADRRGIPAGAYIITQPGHADAEQTGQLFVATQRAESWALIPTVDVELPGLNLEAYTRHVAETIRDELDTLVMGYYSDQSPYRAQTSHLFERHWIAAWRATQPRQPWDVWQYRGSPLDLNRTKLDNLDAIAWGAAPAPPPEPPKPQEEPGMYWLQADENPQYVVEFSDSWTQQIPADEAFEKAVSGMPHASVPGSEIQIRADGIRDQNVVVSAIKGLTAEVAELRGAIAALEQ